MGGRGGRRVPRPGNKLGRPPSGIKRRARQVRVSDAEWLALQLEAQRLGVSPGDLIRGIGGRWRCVPVADETGCESL
jgi:hypothetical protein